MSSVLKEKIQKKVTIHGRFLKKAEIVVLAHKILALFQKWTVKAVLNIIRKTKAADFAATDGIAGWFFA